MNELLASAIDAFTAAWVRPGQLIVPEPGVSQDEDDNWDRAAFARRAMFEVKWIKERDRWMAALHSLIQTALRYPDDGPDVDLDATPNALPSWRQCIESFITNCRASAEAIEMEIMAQVYVEGEDDEEP